MSHEIRTPLGIILGYIDILKDNDLPTQERRAYFEIITRNGQHLAALINDILDLSKVESGELKVKLSHFDLRAIIEEVVTPLEAAAKAKGLFFKVLMDPTLPTEIVSDPMRLKQILLNMISNAIKFTESGGVTIHVSYIQEGEKKWIEIEVQDTGIGIEADKQNLLFRPFVQADASMARKFGGTGLGLALSRKLALTLGGDVTLKRSVPGQGSVFSARVRDHIQSGDQKG
jgi:signal transduction histidine kinase